MTPECDFCHCRTHLLPIDGPGHLVFCTPRCLWNYAQNNPEVRFSA